MLSKERFSSMRTTTCSISAMSTVHLGELESHISSATDPHHHQQIAVEFRHGETPIHCDEEHRSQGERPANRLKSMDRGPVYIGGDVLEPSLCQKRLDFRFVRPQNIV